VWLDDDDPDMVKGCYSTFTPSNTQDVINGQATRIQQGEIQEDEVYHCDTLEGKVFGTKKWWLRHVLMYKIADKYVLPKLKAGARNEIFMQLDQELENMDGWHHLLNELHQMSRRDEKDLREGAIKKVADRRSKNMTSSKLCLVRSHPLREM